MEAEKCQTEAAPSAAAATCGWMKHETKDGKLMTKFKDRFSGFIHAPMDEHKACFKTTIQKMVGKFSLPREGENKLAVEAQAAAPRTEGDV